MLKRRSLSDVSRMQLDLQRLETENAHLRAELAAATAVAAGPPATAGLATSVSGASPTVLATYLSAQAGVHPSARPKKKRKSDDLLKDGIAGAVMTKPEIIARLHEAEQSKREKQERKAAAKAEVASALKQQRERVAAKRKRKPAKQREAEGKKPGAARKPAGSQEGEGWMSYFSSLLSRS